MPIGYPLERVKGRAMAGHDLTTEQIAALVWPLYLDEDQAVVCDFGG